MKITLFLAVALLNLTAYSQNQYWKYAPHKLYGKWGVIDGNQNVLIQPKYTNVRFIDGFDFILLDSNEIINLNTGQKDEINENYLSIVEIDDDYYTLEREGSIGNYLKKIGSNNKISLSLSYYNMENLVLTNPNNPEDQILYVVGKYNLEASKSRAKERKEKEQERKRVKDYEKAKKNAKEKGIPIPPPPPPTLLFDEPTMYDYNEEEHNYIVMANNKKLSGLLKLTVDRYSNGIDGVLVHDYHKNYGIAIEEDESITFYNHKLEKLSTIPNWKELDRKQKKEITKNLFLQEVKVGKYPAIQAVHENSEEITTKVLTEGFILEKKGWKDNRLLRSDDKKFQIKTNEKCYEKFHCVRFGKDESLFFYGWKFNPEKLMFPKKELLQMSETEQ